MSGIGGVSAVTTGTSGLTGTRMGTLTGGDSMNRDDSGFGLLLKDAIRSVDGLEAKARTAIDGLMAGSGVDVHQAMIAAEKATIAFEMALAVRNKAIQSYQSVMSMQF